MSTTQLSQTRACSEETIRRILIQHKIPIRSKRKLTQITAARIVEEYDGGTPSPALAQKVGVVPATVLRYVRAAGDRVRNGREVHRSLCLKTDVFRSPSPEGRYWIGFAMADGCVMPNGTLTFNLQAADREHLEKLKRFLGSDAQIRQGNVRAAGFKLGAPFVKFSVCSKDIVEDLARFGVVPRKSMKERVIGLEMSPDFWRGVVDGDGHVSFHKRGYFQLKLYGSRALCEQFRQFVLVHVPHCRATVHPSRSIFALSLCCGPAVEIARVLYGNATVYLERKFAVVRDLVGQLPSARS